MTSLVFQVSKMGLTTFVAQLVSIFRGKLVIKGKDNNFLAHFLEMYVFEVVTFCSCLVVIQSTQFFNGSTCL